MVHSKSDQNDNFYIDFFEIYLKFLAHVVWIDDLATKYV